MVSERSIFVLWVMTTTRMETRIERVETDLKRLPAMEKTMTDIKIEMGEFRIAIMHLTQRIEEILPQMSDPQGLANVTKASGSRNTNPAEHQRTSTQIHPQTPLSDQNQSYPQYQNQLVPSLTYHVDTNIRKIEMPLFDRERLEVWLYQAEHYFALHEMTEPAKLRVVRIHLIGPMQLWLQSKEKKRPFITWHELKAQQTLRFEDVEAMTIRQRF